MLKIFERKVNKKETKKETKKVNDLAKIETITETIMEMTEEIYINNQRMINEYNKKVATNR